MGRGIPSGVFGVRADDVGGDDLKEYFQKVKIGLERRNFGQNLTPQTSWPARRAG